jgi:hypothetical protein
MSKMKHSSHEYLKLNSNSAIKKNLLEKKNYFEKPTVVNTEVTIFLRRLIEIFEILMMKLEFVVS